MSAMSTLRAFQDAYFTFPVVVLWNAFLLDTGMS